MLRVERCGICGSDVDQCKGELSRKQYPSILGHEPPGIIEEIGERAAVRWGVCWCLTNACSRSLWAFGDARVGRVCISLPIVTAQAKAKIRPEIAALGRPCDLTEDLRLLEARLRAADPQLLTAEEGQALESLLRTVNRLTLPTLNRGD